MNRYLLLMATALLGLVMACDRATIFGREPAVERPTLVPVATVPNLLPTEPTAVPDEPTTTPDPDSADLDTPTDEIVEVEQPLTVAPPDYNPELDALQSWLITAWAERINPVEVQAALQAVGWQSDPAQFVTADLTGDGRDEWLVSLCVAEYDEETGCREMFIDQVMGDLWIVGASGLLYLYSDRYDISWQMAPAVLEIVDLTGDGRDDALIASTSCGAHTCFQHYLVLSVHYGPVANVLNPSTDEQVEHWGEGTSISYSSYQLSAETPPALAIHGGLVGSAGAGIHRGYTEVWQWDGQAISYRDFWWDDSNYRFHRLYDANQAWIDNDWLLARALYEEVIFNDSLEDTEWWYGTAEEVSGYVYQFAAFRLALLDLREGDLAAATAWQNWLRDNFPGSPLTQAADLLIGNFGQTNDVAAACTAVTNFLLTLEDPLGPLHDMGYANPTLQAEDACPLD
jgi:hypothetical protein